MKKKLSSSCSWADKSGLLTVACKEIKEIILNIRSDKTGKTSAVAVWPGRHQLVSRTNGVTNLWLSLLSSRNMPYTNIYTYMHKYMHTYMRDRNPSIDQSTVCVESRGKSAGSYNHHRISQQLAEYLLPVLRFRFVFLSNFSYNLNTNYLSLGNMSIYKYFNYDVLLLLPPPLYNPLFHHACYSK